MGLHRSDGLVALSVGVVLGGWLLVRPVEVQLGRGFEGDQVVVRTRSCGRVLPILLEGEFRSEVRSYHRPACTRTARSRVLWMVLWAGAAVSLAVAAFRRGPQHPTEPISRLPPIPPPPPPMSPAERLREFSRSRAGWGARR